MKGLVNYKKKFNTKTKIETGKWIKKIWVSSANFSKRVRVIILNQNL